LGGIYGVRATNGLHHLLSWPVGHPWNSHKTKAITEIYIWGGGVEGRHSEARMANVGWGSGERGTTHPHQLVVWGSNVSSLTGVHGEGPDEIVIHCSVQWSVLKI